VGSGSSTTAVGVELFVAIRVASINARCGGIPQSHTTRAGLTRYWSWSFTSTTVPDLSYFVGCRPCWFWTKTDSPATNFCSVRVYSLNHSADHANCTRIASSFFHAPRHMGRMDGFVNLESLLTNENASPIVLPKTTSKGDTPQTGSGVFLTCILSATSIIHLVSLSFIAVMSSFVGITPKNSYSLSRWVISHLGPHTGSSLVLSIPIQTLLLASQHTQIGCCLLFAI